MKHEQSNVDFSEAVQLAVDEVVVKSYEAFHTVEPEGKAYFLFTNYRMIFFIKTAKKHDLFVEEFDIHDVSGMHYRVGKVKDKKMSTIAKILLVLSLVLGVLGAVGFLSTNAFFVSNKMIFLGAAGAIFLVSMLVFLFGKRKVFFMEIFGKTMRSSWMTFSSAIFKRKLESVQIKPDASAYKFSKTLGKAIIDARSHIKGEIVTSAEEEKTVELNEEVSNKRLDKEKKKADKRSKKTKEVEKKEVETPPKEIEEQPTEEQPDESEVEEHIDGGIEIQEIS